MSNKRKEVFLRQLEKLDAFTDTKSDLVIDDFWKAHLKQLIIEYIGNDSAFISEVDKLKFSVTSNGEPSDEYFIKYYNQSKTNAKALIARIEMYVDENKIKSNGNFISRLSEGWAIALFTVIFISWGGICYETGRYLTQNKIDKEKISMQNKIDSLLALPNPLVINTNKSPNDSTSNSINRKTNK